MYNYFKATETKPEGWLRRQLEIQAEGLSGNLDKIWPDIRDSAWIGGEKEGWERVPYWLDGFIPLAYLLENDDMIARADKYVNAILDRQQEDGWICPCTEDKRETYDIWALFLIGKVLALYCDFTDSERAKTGLYKAMKNFYDIFKAGKIKLFQWGEFRWYECFIPLRYLYDCYHEDWMLELGKMLREQGADYYDYMEEWKRPLNKWTLQTHIVNLAMMFKYEAVSCDLLQEEYKNHAEELWQFLDKYNGTAVGTFTGDECLSGVANNQGTELCSVVELMYSCELLYAITGDAIWAERLEKAAFNALPATISDDMWTHQYVQQVNQIACETFPGKPFFRTNSEEAHIFGLQPHYGCCTANHNQGWPKLAMSVFLKTDKGVLCSLMLPASLDTTINDVHVTVKNETDYPFRHSCKYTVTADAPVRFELKIRIPSWAKTVKVNGETVEVSEYYYIEKEWKASETVLVEVEDVPHLATRPYDLQTVEYGPLVFALPITTEYTMYEYEKKGIERKFPYCDYELSPKSEWRYGFASEQFEVCHYEGDEIPFSSKAPRIGIKANLSRVDWEFADGYDTVADKVPVSHVAVGEKEVKELVPYGCAKLRMTEMPRVRNN
ncbi:MAG: glycoside hydrolase family 127 protein [Tyzzerella sp.]|nr:glycoside hydrolase family 127 protein [Tyzzerella sp.]